MKPSIRTAAVRGVSLLAGATIGARAIGALSLLVLARLLVPADFGVFSFSLAIVGLLGSVAGLEAKQDLLRDPESAAPKARAYALVHLGLGTTLAGLFFLAADSVAGMLGRPQSAVILRAICLWPLLELLKLTPLGLLEVRFRFRAEARLVLAGTMLRVAGAIVFAALGFRAVALVIGVYLEALVLLGGAWGLAGREILAARIRRRDLRSVRTFGLSMLLAHLLLAWYWRVDDILVGWRLGLAAAGLYAVAFQVPHTMLKVTDAFSPVVSSLLGHHPDPGARARVITVAMRATFAVLAPAVVVGVPHAERLLRVLFGADWAPAAATFRVFLLLALFRGTFRYFAEYAAVKGRPGLIAASRAGIAVLVPVLGWFAMLRWGLPGMALAVLLAWAVPIAGFLAWMRRDLSLRYLPMLLPGGVAALAGLAAGGASRWWAPVETTGGWLLVMAVQLGIYAAVLRLLDPELFRILRASLAGKATREIEAGA